MLSNTTTLPIMAQAAKVSTTILTTKTASALALLRRAAQDYAPAAFSTSLGVEDMVLLDLIATHQLAIEVFTLDTGRLPPQTLDLLAECETRYGRCCRVIFPEADAVEAYVAQYGINGFYASIENRKACCAARKVAPLRRALAGKKSWITGLRAEQSPTRTALQALAPEPQFDLVKVSPLADWTEAEVWAYVHAHDVPVNVLHAQGYPSIGCAPCTRAVAPGEDVRAGRWWWEQPEQKECGLHFIAEGRPQRKKSA